MFKPYSPQLACSMLQSAHDAGNVVGLNHNTGEPMDPQLEGIFDNYSVKKQILNSAYGLVSSSAHMERLSFMNWFTLMGRDEHLLY